MGRQELKNRAYPPSRRRALYPQSPLQRGHVTRIVVETRSSREQAVSDVALLERVAEGDVRALSELSARHSLSLRALAFGILRDAVAAEQIDIAGAGGLGCRLVGAGRRGSRAPPLRLVPTPLLEPPGPGLRHPARRGRGRTDRHRGSRRSRMSPCWSGSPRETFAPSQSCPTRRHP